MELGGRERINFDREKVVEELVRGFELTNQLRVPVDVRENPIASTDLHRDLAEKISDTFRNALSMLQNMLQNMLFEEVNSQSEDGPESVKSSSSKRQRGCYKRREGTFSRDDSPTLLDDGYSWKKYGQKKILHCNHPRDYFRCALTEVTKCAARKHVQRIQDNPPVYRTTYFGHHTCHSSLVASLMISNSDDANNEETGSSNVLRFDKPEDQTRVAFFWPSMKQDKDQDRLSHKVSEEHSSPADELCFSDLPDLESGTDAMEVTSEAALLASLDSFDFYSVLEFVKGAN